jgi:hypothetical protein
VSKKEIEQEQEKEQEQEQNTQGVAAQEGMEKIRELLFGEQVHRFDIRLAELTTELNAKFNLLREELHGAESRLQTRLSETDKAQQSALSREAETRTKEDQALNEELKATAAEWHDKLNALDAQLSDELRSLREHTDQRCDDLDTQLSSHYQELTRMIEHEAERLQQAKVGREGLAQLLEGLAHSLREGQGT